MTELPFNPNLAVYSEFEGTFQNKYNNTFFLAFYICDRETQNESWKEDAWVRVTIDGNDVIKIRTPASFMNPLGFQANADVARKEWNRYRIGLW